MCELCDSRLHINSQRPSRCQRLSLTCLCYLWQRPQDELLSEMIEAGMEAVLIKVAGIGLTTKHLGKTLGEMKPTLTKLVRVPCSSTSSLRLISHVERSLRIAYLWRRRRIRKSDVGLSAIQVSNNSVSRTHCPVSLGLTDLSALSTDVETVIHSDSDFATVAYLRIKSARLDPKESPVDFELKTPPLLDDEFEDACRLTEDFSGSSSRFEKSDKPVLDFEVGSRRKGKWVAVTNVQVKCSTDESIEEEVQRCFNLLQGKQISPRSAHVLTFSRATRVVRAHAGSQCQYKSLPLLHGRFRSRQHGLRLILWHQPSF